MYSLWIRLRVTKLKANIFWINKSASESKHENQEHRCARGGEDEVWAQAEIELISISVTFCFFLALQGSGDAHPHLGGPVHQFKCLLQCQVFLGAWIQ